MKYSHIFLFLLVSLIFACGDPQITQEDIDGVEPVLPIPSEKQMAWQKMEFYAFVHFNMNTFSNKEWGFGDEDPSLFNPSNLDCRQWARICKENGLKGIILTVKHHDGFCLWPSDYTEHSVKNSPWKNGKGDVLQELRDACDEYGLKMGIYYSPWDRNHPDYGKPEYLTYMRNQLTEVLTNYGEIFEVWFDGANGGSGYYGGANENRKVDKKSYYDWPRTFEIVNRLQPQAVIFGDAGLDVRWVGNERGYAYPTTWSNLYRDSIYAGMPEYSKKYSAGQENGNYWVPAEVDVSIRPGWYYHPYEDHLVKSKRKLVDIYYESIGRNGNLLLNFPVDKRGLIHEEDEANLEAMVKTIRDDFSDNLAQNASASASSTRSPFLANYAVDGDYDTFWMAEEDDNPSIKISFHKPTIVNRFLIQEYIPKGQRVKSFKIVGFLDGEAFDIDQQTTIGYKRILRWQNQTVDALEIQFMDYKATPLINNIEIYKADKLLTPPQIERSKEGQVSISTEEKGVEIYYSLDGTNPGTESTKYTGPIEVLTPTEIRAITYDKEKEKQSESTIAYYDIPKEKWKVLQRDEKAKYAIDEDPDTHYHNKNNSITIDLGEEVEISGFTYTPAVTRFISGVITQYKLQGSSNNRNWTTLSEGEFDNVFNNPIPQTIEFGKSNVRYIKFIATSVAEDKNPAYAELSVISK